MSSTIKEYDLDITPGSTSNKLILRTSQYDINRKYKINLYLEGVPFNIPNTANVYYRGRKPDKTIFEKPCEWSGSYVIIELLLEMTNVYGDVDTELVISDGTGILYTGNILLEVERSPYKKDILVTGNDLDLIAKAARNAETIPAILKRIDYLIQNATRGSVYDLSEVIDARISATGTIHDTLGDHIRAIEENGFEPDPEQITQIIQDYMEEHPEVIPIIDNTIREQVELNTTQLRVLDVKINELQNTDIVIQNKINALETSALYLSKKDLAGKAAAHRGYGWAEVTPLSFICQNTIKAFQMAIDNGFDIVELDVQKDKNDVICVFHDATVDNTTNSTGYFKNLDYTTLYYKDGNDKITSEKVITFAEACQWASANNVILEVEIKTNSAVKACTDEEILEIAERYKTKIYFSYLNNQSRLEACQTNHPEVWKKTNLYGQTEITRQLIDEIIQAGYKNLIVQVVLANTSLTPELVNYAYENDIIMCQVVRSYKNQTFAAYAMTFADRGRPNYATEVNYDSGWISYTVDGELLNNYTSSNFAYRRIGNTVFLIGTAANNTWENLPSASDASTRKVLYKLPAVFRPDQELRIMQLVGSCKGYHELCVTTAGNIIPCFTVDPNMTVALLNSNTYRLATSFTAANIDG